MSNPKLYQFDLPSEGRPADVILNEVWYPGVRDYWEDCTSSRIYDAILGIRAVVIHATAGGSSAGAVSVMKEGAASFHWLVPDEDEVQHGKLVWACVPEARAAWHVRNAVSHPEVNQGAAKVNHWSLGIEVVNAQVPTDVFSEWQVRAVARIVRYCWAKYPNLKHIVSHAKLDPSRRKDPGTQFPWDHFTELILDSDADNVPAIAARAPHASTVASPGENSRCCNG